MDKKVFGQKVRTLREEKGITREELCGDETELSVRQLSRIESGISVPSVSKVMYIARQLGIAVGKITDGKSLDLPKRYQELKYLIVRAPTYGNPKRIEEGERYFDEIYCDYYDSLPEDEKLVVDCLQSKWDVHLSDDINFGTGILNDYFDQVKKKTVYSFNDLVIIDLYLLCVSVGLGSADICDKETYFLLMDRLLEKQKDTFSDDLYLLNNVLLNHFSLAFRLNRIDYIENILLRSQEIMAKIHDFQKMPILNMVGWKYSLLHKKNKDEARGYFEQSILFAKLINDEYLEGKLVEEWHNDTT